MNIYSASKPEKDCQWHPIYRDQNDNGVGPSEPMQENFRKTPYAFLVREAIQNPLDVVKDNSQPMEIEFSIGTIDSRNFPNFFDLRKHIEGCIENFPNNEKAKKIYPPMLDYLDRVNRPGEKLHFIRVSDHNTKGMHYDNPEDNDAPFYAFVRSAGVSSKADESAGGSFGFGKAAYFYLSPIRTILVSTKTDNNKYYFEGVTSLCSHKIDGRTVSNIVYYDNNNGQPTTEYDKIPNRFQRKDNDGNEFGSGTDIFIMGVDFENYGDEDSIYKQMYYSVLENFWLAVLHNKLVVRIGRGDKERLINASNIATIISENFDEHDANIRKNYNPRPYFDAVNLANTSDRYVYRKVNLNEFSELTDITFKDWGRVHYYFYKSKKAQNRIVYMRGLKMKVLVSPGRNGEGYYGVIVCPDGECNKVLRQTEDPAHSKWDANRLENKKERDIAKLLLGIIESEKDRIIRDIFKLDEIETIKIKGLEQYLYISTEVDDEDEEESASSMTGSPSGKYVEDGYSPTTIGGDIRNNPALSSEPLVGNVLTNNTGKIVPDQQGNILTGQGETKIKKPRTRIHIPAVKPTTRNSKNENGREGYTLEPISVRYRSFAQKANGTITHKIIINSPYDIPRGQVDLLVGGESSDSKIRITSSTKGDVQGNSIVNLQLNEGRNELSVHFADNLQHSVKLEAYEIK